jgi:hypothetical protein
MGTGRCNNTTCAAATPVFYGVGCPGMPVGDSSCCILTLAGPSPRGAWGEGGRKGALQQAPSLRHQAPLHPMQQLTSALPPPGGRLTAVLLAGSSAAQGVGHSPAQLCLVRYGAVTFALPATSKDLPSANSDQWTQQPQRPDQRARLLSGCFAAPHGVLSHGGRLSDAPETRRAAAGNHACRPAMPA